MNRSRAYATTTGIALPEQPAVPARAARAGRGPAPTVRDLRERGGRGPRVLVFGARDVVVVTGLPGSGKSTLMRRAVPGPRVDSQDTRDRWERRTPRFLPYAVYRPLVRLSHYAGLRRALRTAEGLVVHDCGTQAWVRRWVAREARRRGGALHLLLLDVPPEQALAGQRDRGRGVSRYAFRRHRAAMDRLLRAVQRGRLPQGCASATLTDRDTAAALHRITFTDRRSEGR
ncbi:AAA family ATPase [Streptomyces sp. NPDC001046]|uniref:AAA family ATPase n=1 Tax=Streptomyces sp. NPDC001046 TaxID=3364543 RepID=UPI0036AA4357